MTRPDINIFSGRGPCWTGGIQINEEKSGEHSRGAEPRQRQVGPIMAWAGDTEGPAGAEVSRSAGGMMRDGAETGGKTGGSVPLYPPSTAAHLFRAPAMGEGAKGSPLEGLEQLSRGSLPQRGSREGSGVGGDRPWKLRARGRGTAPGCLWKALGSCSLELSWKSSSMEM